MEYRWTTEYYHPDNTFTLNDYINNHMLEEFVILWQDGNIAEVRDTNTMEVWMIHATGDGDSFNHLAYFERR